MTFSNLLKISLVALTLFACSEEKEELSVKEKVQSYLEKVGKKDALKDKDALIYFYESRNCLKCTEIMLKSSHKYLNSSNVLYVLTGGGFALDISKLKEKERDNVIIDASSTFNEIVGMEGSGFVLLNEDNNRDTTVLITAKGLAEQLPILYQHIERNY